MVKMASPAKIRPKSEESFNGSENDYEDDVDSIGGNTEEFHVMRMEPRPFRPFKTSEEYLYAMKEDLAEWLNTLYSQNITVDDFFERLETGVLICKHANGVTKMAQEFKMSRKLDINIPERDVVYKTDVQPGTFKARDNISNFITWCRALNIKECLLFETDDLVMRKNERSFILCLLEVARCGARYGMPAPVLVQMEQEIDAEIEENGGEGVDTDYARETVMTRSYQTQEQRMAQLMGLHERVVNLLNRCTCPSQFPMIKVADGKYRIGDTKVLIFVRILRNHVMVRVGGGWDTLEHYLDKHDPCRCRSGHRFSTSAKLNMSVGKGGSPNMQVTYNRPSQNDSFPYRISNSSNYAMEHGIEPGEDSFKSGSSMDYAINPGRKSHDFSSHNYNTYQYANARKPRSKSFDNSSNYLTREENMYIPSNVLLKQNTPKGTKKENSDPHYVEQSFAALTDKNGSPRKAPLASTCPNKIPLQKSASKSKIPCLEHPLQKSPKSQSTEDLFRTKYFLGADDRWMRSRSSSSSPVHGTPRSTSMEQCSLSSLTAVRKNPSRRNSQHEESSQFLRARPGQYSFRMTKKSPELRRKNDSTNKTWSFHNKGQRPPLHPEWTSASSRSAKPSPLATQHSPPTTSKSGRYSTKVSNNRPGTAPSPRPELDLDDKNSTEILRNLELLIDECQSKFDKQQEDTSYENHNTPYNTNHNGINDQEISLSPENGLCKTNGTSNLGTQRNRLSRESPTGSASRIPVPQWK